MIERMPANYTYKTGKIERDFRIVRCGEKCKLSGLPTWVGEGRCNKCPYKEGLLTLNGFYIACNHPEQKDSENIGEALQIFYEKFQRQALEALCY
ncbi:MAG: hypothetical protein J5965_07805 [Aeriscardovia sp.]|nr:hypothetical protein [Aeriscardovia sp.]